MTAPPREPTPEPCVNCGKARSDHYIVNFADGPQISGMTWICPGSVYAAAPASSAEQRAPVRVPCPNKVDGVCPLPNVHCAYPKCTEGTAPLSHVTPAGPPAPRAQAATDDLVRRLDGYNPPDRTIAAQRQIAVDIANASAALKRQAREIAELQATLKRQAAAALRGMDAAKAISSGQLKEARRMHAESNPAALDSERAANAALTERAERAEAERDEWKRKCGDANEWGLIHTAAWKYRAERAEAERDALRECVRELVACKDLKDELDALREPPPVNSSPQHQMERSRRAREVWNEYEHRKPLAWKAARAKVTLP